MAAIAVRKKVISISHFSPCFHHLSLQTSLFVRLNQEQLYVLNALKSEKNRNEPNELDEQKYKKSITQMTSLALRHILVFSCSNMYQNNYPI